MGAVFAILFFLFSFGGGAAVFLAGTVGLIISGTRKKKGMPAFFCGWTGIDR